MSATARANVPAKQSALDRELEERLVRYVRIDTQSDERSTTSPSTDRQYDLLRLLAEELRAIGAEDVRLADYGTVLATIPATTAVTRPACCAYVVLPNFCRMSLKACSTRAVSPPATARSTSS